MIIDDFSHDDVLGITNENLCGLVADPTPRNLKDVIIYILISFDAFYFTHSYKVC